MMPVNLVKILLLTLVFSGGSVRSSPEDQSPLDPNCPRKIGDVNPEPIDVKKTGVFPVAPKKSDSPSTSGAVAPRPEAAPVIARADAAKITLPEYLKSQGYEPVTYVATGGAGKIYEAARKDGKKYIFKEVLLKKDLKTLESEQYFLTKLQGAHEAEVANAKKAGHPVPPNYFGETVEFVAGSSGHPAYLKTDLFAKSNDPKSPDHEIRSPTLKDRLENGTITDEMEEKIIVALADAIAAMHQNRVVHYDLKPANILVNDQGEIRIIDFGVSADLGETPRFLPPGGMSAAAGTLAYMSAHQMEGNPAQSRDDVYSLGKTLMEMVSLRRIKKGETDAANTFQWSFIGVGKILEYTGPADLGPKKRALAIALFDYHERLGYTYETAILNANKMTETEFMKWYGERLKGDLVENRHSAKGYKEIARRILSSKALIENFPTGLGFEGAEIEGIKTAVATLRTETKAYYDDKGARLAKLVRLGDPSPYLLFKDYDAQNPPPKRGLWGLRGLFGGGSN